MKKKLVYVLGIFTFIMIIFGNSVKADDEIDYEAFLQDFIDTNITNNMTDLQKLIEITKYTAENYDYDYRYQSYQSMIKYGGGDCWASTNMIVKLCNMVGIQAKGRNANQDVGAGSGHRNVIALIDGKYYIAEAGYSEPKPRYYNVTETSAFMCNYNYTEKTATLIQYDGFDTDIVVPSAIGQYTITTIGKSAFYRSSVKVTSVTLPNTITKIEENAFFYCDSLKKITIPSSVTELSGSPFCLCKNLEEIKFEGNHFIVEDNCIYTKDKTKLIEVLQSYNKEVLKIPETVTIIGSGAVCYNEKIKEVILPSCLQEIEHSAFWRSYIRGGITIPGSCKKIGNNSFASSWLGSVIIENGVEEIGLGAFYSMYYLQSIQIPSSVQKIGENIISSYKDVTVYGESGSQIEKYTQENNLNFVSGEINEIFPYNFWFIPLNNNAKELVYNGEKQYPEFKILIGGKSLVEAKDYIVTFKTDSINAGTHSITITGIGKYSGTFEKEYTIQKAEPKIEFICEDTIEGISFSPKVTYNPNNLNVGFWYKKDGQNWYSNAAYSAGEYEIWPYIEGNNNYKALSDKKIKAKIVEKKVDWNYVGNHWYWVDENKNIAKGWKFIDNRWYWFNENGEMITGWKYINNKWYWFNASGEMTINWKHINNKWYWFNENGEMVTGWKYINNRWYWFNASGEMITGWKYINNKWYWFSESGEMATDWKLINNQWYLFDTNGAWIK